PGGGGVQRGGDEEGGRLRGPVRVLRGALRPGLDLPFRGAGDARSPDPDSAAGRRLLGGSFADRRQFRLPHVGPDDRARGAQRAALLHNAVLGGAAGVASPRGAAVPTAVAPPPRPASPPAAPLFSPSA